MEGITAITTGKLLSLSEQQLVDCSSNMGNAGCDGGWMYGAFNYAVDNAMELEGSYTYSATNGVCKSSLYNGVT